MSQPRILAFAGSTRTESFNKRLVAVAAQMAENQGAEVTRIDLRDLPENRHEWFCDARESWPTPKDR